MFPGLVSGLRVDTGYSWLAHLPASCLAALAPCQYPQKGLTFTEAWPSLPTHKWVHTDRRL